MGHTCYTYEFFIGCHSRHWLFSKWGNCQRHDCCKFLFSPSLILGQFPGSPREQAGQHKLDYCRGKECKSFDIERSFNGSEWTIIIPNIAATNGNGNTNYVKIDTAFSPKKLLYRIRQTDVDGTLYFFNGENRAGSFRKRKNYCLPVPADNSFSPGY